MKINSHAFWIATFWANTIYLLMEICCRVISSKPQCTSENLRLWMHPSPSSNQQTPKHKVKIEICELHLEMGGFLADNSQVACAWQNHRLPQAMRKHKWKPYWVCSSSSIEIYSNRCTSECRVASLKKINLLFDASIGVEPWWAF